MTPRRFGEIALDLRYVRREELEIALDYQANLRARERRAPPIGALLVKLGYLRSEQVLEILEIAEQERARLGEGVRQVRLERGGADVPDGSETHRLDPDDVEQL